MEKVKIVRHMNIEAGECKVRGDSMILRERVTLCDFSMQRTRKILTSLNINPSFLSIPPETWDENDDYKKGRERGNNLRIVNDTAKPGVTLFKEFNILTTNDENEKQFLLQVVEKNRKSVPTYRLLQRNLLLRLY